VVTNPTQVAVAIQYDRKEMAAPEVVAKGQRKWAEMIIQIAKEEHVPIIRNIPLAWSLLQVEEGDAIPEDLYEPVAEVLTFVYEMKEKEKGVATITSQAVPETKPAAEQKPKEFKPF
jgi:flagellar biosynthetic protein FlhB